MEPLYLDHNATTPIAPEVFDAMVPWLRDHFGNPSSSHPFGAVARQAVDRARAQVAALIGAAPGEVLFTSGGTEANNLALFGLRHRVERYVSTTVEHPATARPLDRLEDQGVEVRRIRPDAAGVVDAEAVLEAAAGAASLISVMLANNETGALQPVAPIGRQKEASTLLHTDAAQAVGKVPVDVGALGVDLLSLAGHKLYAPKGVGALYLRRGVPLQPLLLGADHERGLRPGTENVASIVGLGAACTLAAGRLETDLRAQSARTDRLWGRLSDAVPGLRLHGPPEGRLPNTLNVGFPGVAGSAVLAHAPEVAASTGSACDAHGESPSAVLLEMGLAPDQALGAVRLSLGRHTTDADVDRAADALARAWRAASEGR